VQEEKKMQQEVKLLLLGAGASGKSTVLKQMRLIHDKPFTEDEIEDYRCGLPHAMIPCRC
jgi:guanine nucleotide-binding protein subunit alpha